MSFTIFTLLDSKKTYKFLLLLIFILSCIVFYVFRDLDIGDEAHYLSFAEGLKHGRFSHWWFLSEYVPDTFRTPGYPFFLFLLEKISNNIYFLKFFQFILYLTSVWMILKVADEYDSGYRLKNIFLILLLPYIHVAVFSPTIVPETLMTFFITLYIYIDTKHLTHELKYTLLGLLSGVIFLVRPIFLVFPFLLVITNLIFRREKFKLSTGLIMIFIFLLSIIPYGFWNLKNHKVFSLTPIEGAGGVFQLGYWSFKMPGYFQDRYWRNFMSNEIISFTSDEEKEKNIRAYNEKWNYIDSVCSKYLTAYDSLTLAVMDEFPYYFKTYNTEYTLQREKLLRKLTIEDMKSDLKFTLKVKLFTLMRSWVTGLQLDDLHSTSFLRRAGAIYFSFISAIIFFASVILIPLAIIRQKLPLQKLMTIILLLVYFGLVHLPFAIQARYTIPVRLALLFMLAIALLNLFSKNPRSKIFTDHP